LEVAPKGIGVRGKSGEQLHRNEAAQYQPESACTTSLHRRSLPVSKVLWLDLFDIMAMDCVARPSPSSLRCFEQLIARIR
jgi:hypothetical protein